MVGDRADALACSSSHEAFSTLPATNNGISCQQSRVKIIDITDGTTNTYLVGEKNVMPDYYYNGLDGGDNNSALGGDDCDLNRWTRWPPMVDWPGQPNSLTFGSAHLVGFGMAFCDGSVRTVNYTIDPTIHSYLGDRKDGKVIDAKKL